MFDKLDLNNLAGMLGDVQKKAQEMQELSANKIFEAKSGGGMVKVKANGNGEIIDLIIDDGLLSDKDSLGILIMSAINDVLKSVESDKKNSTMNMLGDFNTLFKKS